VNSLVESHRRVALAKAERYRRFGLQDAEVLDLVQESSLGLIQAARNYDPQKGRFQTYAVYWIQQAIGRYLLKRGHLLTPPSQILQASRKGARTARELEARLERTPTSKEIAKAVGLPVETVREAQEASAWCVSLETPIGKEDLTLGDLLVDDRIVGFDEDD
jgi:DNA-directed RNA polymerase sigma subunit (sigma70/sigma32)